MSEHDAGSPQRCHCGRGWFNPQLYGECARCRHALIEAISTVRRACPGARTVGTPALPYPQFEVAKVVTG